jgi:hypothetical protein
MKRLALLNPYKSIALQAVTKQNVAAFLAGPDNIGNRVYLTFLEETLTCCDSVTTEAILANPAYIKETYDLVVLPFSNMLTEHFTTPLANVFVAFEIPILLLSVGVQHTLDTPLGSISLSHDTHTLLHHARTVGTPIGVRGAASQAVLKQHGFDSIVIGCPSVFAARMPPAEKLAGFKERIVGNCTFSGNHKTLTAELVAFLVCNSDGYIFQDEYPLIRDVYDIATTDIPLTAFKDTGYHRLLDNPQYMYTYYNDNTVRPEQVRQYFLQKARFFFQLDQWMKYLSTFTCSIGLRFHGNVVALQCGVPAVFMPCDLRTSELIEHHKLPHINHPQQYHTLSAHMLTEQMGAFEDVFSSHYKTFQRYLELADISDNYASDLSLYPRTAHSNEHS